MEERFMTSILVNSATETVESQQECPADADRGDLALLVYPVAQELLQSRLPARLAYVARDGTPRVVPMQFHWTGEEIVLSCWPDDPKVVALRAHPQVALTIDTAEPPFKVLQIRGTAAASIVDGVSPEMEAASIRYMGQEAGQAWIEQAARLSQQTARIAIRPSWVDVLDFETRLPGGMVRRMAGAAA
jgi:PPOX class probable F420-dependent enzyme